MRSALLVLAMFLATVSSARFKFVHVVVIEPATCTSKAVVEVTVSYLSDGSERDSTWSLTFQRLMLDDCGNRYADGPTTIHNAHGFTTRFRAGTGYYQLYAGGVGVELNVSTNCAAYDPYGLNGPVRPQEPEANEALRSESFGIRKAPKPVDPDRPNTPRATNTINSVKREVGPVGEGGGGGGTPTPAYRSRVGSGATPR